jgi:addiction module HigA family antidote
MPAPKKLPPVHPGEILADELQEICISMNQFAKALRVPANRITAIVHGTRGITGETALRLARYFGTSAEMWINLQARYDLEVARDAFEAKVRKEIQPRQSEAA